MDWVKKLEDWYRSHCEEDNISGATPWQHRYGLNINTSDNPAWNIGIDLVGTELEGLCVPQVIIDNGENDWYRCQIQQNRFGGVGDPSKLGVMLKWFFDIVDERRTSQTSAT